MLQASNDDGLEEVDIDPVEIACSDCTVTLNTVCGKGIDDVCYLDDNNPVNFDEDAIDSVRRFCSGFGAACGDSAMESCDGQCTDACSDVPCLNGASCSIDPAGGHVCSCATGFGGMSCQTDTTSLDTFYIEIEFNGIWTESREDVFRSAADRWAEVITHVPCGGNVNYPAGRLLLNATLEEIDGAGSTLGSAGPRSVWSACPTISAEGVMTFDIEDIDSMESAGTFEGVVLHEMGHAIGIGTLWGNGFGECTTCREDDDPAWLCPAALSAYYDLGGTSDDIIEFGGGEGTSCAHLDETTFDDELMTGYLDTIMFLSKMTAAILEDLDYIVDPSEVDDYALPPNGISIRSDSPSSIGLTDTPVDHPINLLDENGVVVEEKIGVIMEF
eukprot:jgi/Undpi1/8904/HiC_scaffold_25.g11366.m1